MSILQSWLVACFVGLFLCGSVQAQSPGLKLIPIPREVTAGAIQPVSQGIQVSCINPCSPEDSFAVNDFKEWLGSIGVAANTTAPVNILVARYGAPLANSIYSDSLPAGSQGSAAAKQMPEEMKAEGYSIIPDGKGLALTATSDAGIFYALQTAKQLITGYGN